MRNIKISQSMYESCKAICNQFEAAQEATTSEIDFPAPPSREILFRHFRQNTIDFFEEVHTIWGHRMVSIKDDRLQAIRIKHGIIEMKQPFTTLCSRGGIQLTYKDTGIKQKITHFALTFN